MLEHPKLDTPAIVQTQPEIAAVIHLTIPRARIQEVMGPAFGELHTVLAAQGLDPSGPPFSHHQRLSPDLFDFEVGFPVPAPVAPFGRVMPGELPGATVVRSVYRGPYEGLADAWAELGAWMAREGLAAGPSFWERYLIGPEAGPEPAAWRTELNRPIVVR